MLIGDHHGQYFKVEIIIVSSSPSQSCVHFSFCLIEQETPTDEEMEATLKGVLQWSCFDIFKTKSIRKVKEIIKKTNLAKFLNAAE